MVDGFGDASRSGWLSADVVRGIAHDLDEGSRDMASLARALDRPGARLEEAHVRRIEDFRGQLAACRELVKELTARRAS
ncbi:hypothetical protein GCM10009821_28190 [Aeromicrobium halocynthiae]|uniref:Uncharacterized protein n=1 Tax=Aeromicrobium halocynthiae TaxID=560557 RepID=A0ABN2W919_9ACTN